MKETIEQAAREYAKRYSSEIHNDGRHTVILSYTARNSFEAGAEWQSNQSPWISVEERLPEHMQAVWVKSDIKNYQPLRFCDGKFYTSFAHQTYDGSVTHWMPIP